MQSQPLPNNQPKKKRYLGSLIFSILLLTISVLVWLNRQYIYDSVSFWRYEPTAGIMSITEKVDFTDSGKFIFYATHPVLDGNRTFNAKCDRKEHGAAVLGCYVNDRIYLFDVTDERLKGIKEVTAVHEMLHAVYQRLSDDDKARVNELIEAEYEKLRNDKDLAERMEFYARTEPVERDNELHSIIGTEVTSISPELETHYAKYLENRQQIVDYHQTYRQAFEALEEQRDSLSKELDALSAQIESTSATYNQEAEKLKSDIETFNQRANAGSFSSQAQFNRERSTLVGRVSALTNERDTINSMAEQYNQLKEQYNTIVTESNELYKSIDSNLAPAPQV